MFSCSVMSNSLWPRELQHTRLPCPSPTPGVCSNSCPLIQWCHPTISSSVATFSSRLQSFPASGSFQMSQFFASGGQSIGASASILPMNKLWIKDWFPLGLTGLISLLSKGLSKVFSSTTIWKHQFFATEVAKWKSLLWFPRVAARTEPALLLHRPGLKQRMLWSNGSEAAFGLAVFL